MTPEDAHVLQGKEEHTSETHSGGFADDNATTSDDGDDASRASSELSWSVELSYRNMFKV